MLNLQIHGGFKTQCGMPFFFNIHSFKIEFNVIQEGVGHIPLFSPIIKELTLSNRMLSVKQHKFAREVKRHNVCKRHGFLDIGFKQTKMSPFRPQYPNGIKKIELILNVNLKKLYQNCQ